VGRTSKYLSKGKIRLITQLHWHRLLTWEWIAFQSSVAFTQLNALSFPPSGGPLCLRSDDLLMPATYDPMISLAFNFRPNLLRRILLVRTITGSQRMLRTTKSRYQGHLEVKSRTADEKLGRGFTGKNIVRSRKIHLNLKDESTLSVDSPLHPSAGTVLYLYPF
jgi:hypothetical protein